MKVFISWSGDISLRFAQNFADWLGGVIQAVKPFVSAKDIRTGSRWFAEIGKHLEETDFGILCVTPDNKEAPWLLFEAGALSKRIEHSHVCPLLLGVKNADLKPPLSMFHTADATGHQEMRKLLTDINAALGEKGLNEGVLSKVFGKNWPDLDKTIQATLGEIREAQKTHGMPTKRPSEDMLEELLGITRGIAQNLADARASISAQTTPESITAAFDRWAPSSDSNALKRTTTKDTFARAKTILELANIDDQRHKAVVQALINQAADYDKFKEYVNAIQKDDEQLRRLATVAAGLKTVNSDVPPKPKDGK